MNTYSIIQTLAKERQINMRTLISELGLAEGTVYGWKGMKEPKLASIIKIADYFNVSVDYLLGRTSQRKIYVDDKPIPALKLELIQKIETSNYSDEQTKIIMDFITNTETFHHEEDES